MDEGGPQIIRFYDQNATYGWGSNFSLHPIVIDGVTYPTNEHYFQSQKFVKTNPAMAKTVMKAETAGKAKRLGKRDGIDPDWDNKKIEVMKTCVLAKFTQHEKLRRKLLDTGDAILIENTKKDYFWGCGTNGTGQNHLGKILMEVRDSFKPVYDESDYRYWVDKEFQ